MRGIVNLKISLEKADFISQILTLKAKRLKGTVPYYFDILGFIGQSTQKRI